MKIHEAASLLYSVAYFSHLIVVAQLSSFIYSSPHYSSQVSVLSINKQRLQFNTIFFTAERMDKNTSLYVLFNVGDQFCSVMQEEKKAITQAGEKGEKT